MQVLLFFIFNYIETKEASRGKTELLSHTQTEVPEEKSEPPTKVTDGGNTPHAGALPLDHDDVNPINIQVARRGAGKQQLESNEIACIAAEPANPEGRLPQVEKVELKEELSQTNGEEKPPLKDMVRDAYPINTWLALLFRHIFVSLLGLAVGYMT